MNIGETYYCSRCMREMEDEGICPYCGYNPMEGSDSDILEEGTLLYGKRYQLGTVIARDDQGVSYTAWDYRKEEPVVIREFFPAYARRDVTVSDEVSEEEKERKTYEKDCRSFRRRDCRNYFERNHTVYVVTDFSGGSQNAAPDKRVPRLCGVGTVYEGEAFAIPKEGLVIGRDASCCNLVIPQEMKRGISRMHCRLEYDAKTQSFRIYDLNSRYGTYLRNGMKLERPVEIYPGEEFFLADRACTFRVER